MKVIINDRQKYDECVKQGYEPLMSLVFQIDIELRKEIQRELFGRGNTSRANQKFYLWIWRKMGPVRECEECGVELLEYRAYLISHILPRGAFPEMAHDPRNVNLLCFRCHRNWETQPLTMAIYGKNDEIMKIIKKEYRYKQWV